MLRDMHTQIVTQTVERTAQSGKEIACLGETFGKKRTLPNISKSTTENVSFFNCEQIFVVREDAKTPKDY